MEDLSILSRAVSAPIVYQDYILNEYHVTEARAAGASALVLYASLMDAKELRQVVSITQRWRMTSIVEVNNEDEMATASALSPHVIGVGMRTVFERERDLEKLSRLRQQTPYNTRFMLLGCLETLDDVAAVAAVGVHAVIVDETLLTPQHFGTLLEIIGRPVR
jgi:indole-3-glycerol phosphate synthase